MQPSQAHHTSPGSREHLQYPAITAVQQHLASNAQSSIFADYFDDALGPEQILNPLQQYLGYSEPYTTAANTSSQSDFASSVDAQTNAAQVQSDAEAPGLICAGREAQQKFSGAASPYNTQQRSYFPSTHSTFTPMATPLPSAHLTEGRPTPYSVYRGLFLDSDAARDHRHMSTRFGRQPYIPPEDDPSVEDVERNRNYHLGRIYDAMICGDRAQDNPGSIAMKRWVNGAHYKSDLVEAFAHKVFDCLLVQVKEGFRGWHHNDYVDDDRKGEKEDREADCANRLENIIDALEREKTICEDVVNSASQIRMFVNAPVAYAQRKFQNRQGNSKRGRMKDASESNSRSAKMRRTGGRQTQTPSSATPDRPVRDTTPHFQIPYYTSGSSQQLPSAYAPCTHPQRPTMSTHMHPGYRHATVTDPPTTQHLSPDVTLCTAVMSPPPIPASRSHTTHTDPMPKAQMFPLHYQGTYHSDPPSPSNVTYPSPTSPSDWASDDFSQHVTLSDLEHPLRSVQAGGEGDPVGGFEELWNEIPGVQHFSFDDSKGGR